MKTYFIALTAALLAIVSADRTSAQGNPFFSLVNALTDDGSPFNGPDRPGGADTLHGEVSNRWFVGYQAVDLYDQDPNNDTWASVDVPTWLDNSQKIPVEPDGPELPVYLGLVNGLHIVDGHFLVGAIKWPHEEYVEQYAAGTLSAIADEHKVPVYWVVGYRLYIPADYADPFGTPDVASRRGKALIIQAGGEDDSNYNTIRPPWMIELLTSTDWRANAALRLGVPVLYLGPNPVSRNTFARNGSGLEQGGVTGYWTEALADFADHWSIKAPEADPLRDHPQFMYVASFIRARTFLDGFFNPTQAMGTAAWSKWDDITNNNTGRYTAMADVTLQVCPHFAPLAQLACAADPALTDLTVIEPGQCALTTTSSEDVNRAELDLDHDQLPARKDPSSWAGKLLGAAANR